MTIADTRLSNTKIIRFVAFVLAVAAYVFLVRGLLFAYLHEHQMLDWYGSLIDAFNRATKSGFGQGIHPLEEYRQRLDILLFQLAVIITLMIGLRRLLRTREGRILLGVNVVFILLLLGITELFLSTDAMQRKTGGSKYIALDSKISKRHLEGENSLGFTDRERSLKRNGDTFRIAVLGDSFVWGDGVDNLEDVWSHRLEAGLVEEFGESVEVMTWGRRGWSTCRQLEFLKNEGRDFEIDLLIVGYVFNDPHIPGKSMPRRTFVWQKVVQKLVPFFKNTTRLTTETINGFLYALPYFKNWGYEGWQKQLYSDGNLAVYRAILAGLQTHLQARNIDYVFVVTPTMQHREASQYFGRVEQLFLELDIPYLDLRPAVDEAFGNYSPAKIRAELWANPADSHPGPALHALYAKEVRKYLRDRGLSGKVASRSNSDTGLP